MARKETLQLKRDPRSMVLAFLLPMVLIVFFGYAISFDVKNIELAVLDQDRTQQSERLVESFSSSGYFNVVRRLEAYGEAATVLDRGEARLVLVIPPNFSRDLADRRWPTVQLLLDGGDANTATIAQSYADVIIAGFSQGGTGTPLAAMPVRVESRAFLIQKLSQYVRRGGSSTFWTF